MEEAPGGWGRKRGTPPAPPAGGAAPRRLLPRRRRPPGISRRARFRRWQRWPGPERPAMARAPSPLCLALLLLGAVGRVGPRPQVRPVAPGGMGRRRGALRAAGAGSRLGRPGLERNSATAGGGNRSPGGGSRHWRVGPPEPGAWTAARGGGSDGGRAPSLAAPVPHPQPGHQLPRSRPALTSAPHLPRPLSQLMLLADSCPRPGAVPAALARPRVAPFPDLTSPTTSLSPSRGACP